MEFENNPGNGRQSARCQFLVAGMLFLFAVSTFSLAGCDSRATLTANLVVEAFKANQDNPVTNPKDVTSEKCGAAVPCKEAIRADEISVYSFGEKEEAEAFARTLGENGYQSNWVVLEYDGAAADTDRSKASYASTVDGMWSSD